ncbi:MAG: transporter related [Frankiales bacterium]|nr:transporter related [Frankiales bacterium]
MTAAIEVDDVSKRFRLYADRNQSLKAALLKGGRATYEDFWALRDVAFDVPEGSTFGLIGENGSGKSTLLKCMARILLPDKGAVRTRGRLAALLELGSGFHPELSGRENVFLNGSILGLSRGELDRRFEEIVDFSGVEQFIDQPVKNYSSGMYVRLGFAVAIHVDPDVLLVDEVLAVGDAAFQRKCEERFADLRASGRTVVLVSHAMGSMRTLCDTVAWLEHGELQRVGPSSSLVDDYVDGSHEDRVVDQQGGTRWGSGEAQVLRVEVLRDGQPRTSFSTGDSVVLRLHYEAHQRIENPVFGWSIETVEGVYVWAHHSRDGEMVPDAIEGRGHVDLVVDALPLQPGVFDLSASVVAYDCVHEYDHRKRLLRFDVGFGTPRESGGLVVFGGRWQPPVSR